VFAGDTRGARKSSTDESLELIDDEKKRENSIIYHTKDFSKYGLPLYGNFGVLCLRGRYTYIGRKTRHIYIS
jgi:hypothetical protein